MAIKINKLEPHVYQALEDVVGSEHITNDPVIMDSYCFVWGMDVLHEGSGKFGPRPDAVILPGSTEEVQAIVKVCNRHKIIYKAMSTGFSTQAFGARDGWICIDMRRMNRIIEIDEKNMYAVLEPYVTFGQLMDEAHKKGLRCHAMSGGNQCSVVANFSQMVGGGAAVGLSTGGGNGDLLGVEWVLPDGEVVRLGSAEIGAGWFCGVGPGPGLMGVLKGGRGAAGSLGVVTKISLRLTPWYGPPVLEVEGANPNYVPVLPECIRLYDVTFPTRPNMADAMYMLSEQGIAYACHRRGPFSLIASMTASNQETWEYYQDDEYLARLQNLLQITIDASSPREMEYREKALYHIIKKFDGELPPELNENDRYNQRRRFLYPYNCVGGYKASFRSGNAFIEMGHDPETLDCHQIAVDIWLPIKQEYMDRGVILQDGDSSVHGLGEDGRGGGGSQSCRYDQTNPESVKAVDELRDRIMETFMEHNLAGVVTPSDKKEGQSMMYYISYIEKVKASFDPNLVSEYAAYPTPGVELVKMVE